MQVYRIYITAWTASFRYPNIISGFQPTLLVPPFSTIIGLISAAKGDYFIPNGQKIGYVFRYNSKNVDIETIYQIKNIKDIKSNVLKREFLYKAELFLYTDSIEIMNYFKNPVYPLLLGRSSDLASVIKIEALNVSEKNKLAKIKGTILPLGKYGLLPGIIQALPKSFTNTIPRKNINTQPYCVIDFKNNYEFFINAKGFYDFNKELKIDWDVYWQE